MWRQDCLKEVWFPPICLFVCLLFKDTLDSECEYDIGLAFNNPFFTYLGGHIYCWNTSINNILLTGTKSEEQECGTKHYKVCVYKSTWVQPLVYLCVKQWTITYTNTHLSSLKVSLNSSVLEIVISWYHLFQISSQHTGYTVKDIWKLKKVKQCCISHFFQVCPITMSKGRQGFNSNIWLQ